MTDASQLPLPRRVEKENLAAFISKKREIFMVQMALDIKRQEMQRLAQQAAQVTCPADSPPCHTYPVGQDLCLQEWMQQLPKVQMPSSSPALICKDA